MKFLRNLFHRTKVKILSDGTKAWFRSGKLLDAKQIAARQKAGTPPGTLRKIPFTNEDVRPVAAVGASVAVVTAGVATHTVDHHILKVRIIGQVSFRISAVMPHCSTPDSRTGAVVIFTRGVEVPGC